MMEFEWEAAKEIENIEKHGISFYLAQHAFADPDRIIAEDIEHSLVENRFYCFGEIEDGIITVRFTNRGKRIRIFGAGFWRKGKRIYENENSLHR